MTTSAALSFYQLLSTISFTLLGLWFVVQGLSHGSWRSDPTRHRATLHIALHFFLPGMMGLGAVLGGENVLIWRVVFVVGALAGLIESIRFLRDPHGPRAAIGRALRAVDPVLYVLIGASAFVYGPVGALAPLQIEGIATGLLFVVGMTYVWLAYAEPPVPVPAPTRDPAT